MLNIRGFKGEMVREGEIGHWGWGVVMTEGRASGGTSEEEVKK